VSPDGTGVQKGLAKFVQASTTTEAVRPLGDEAFVELSAPVLIELLHLLPFVAELQLSGAGAFARRTLMHEREAVGLRSSRPTSASANPAA